MNNDKTRLVGAGGGLEKTRLVRKADAKFDAADVGGSPGLGARAKDIARTKLAARSNKAEVADHQYADGAEPERKVTGWLAVIDGPGRGSFAAIFEGMNSIGRGSDQATQIDFGDESISRADHAFITYDFQERTFHITHGGKANVVRLNDKPVLQPLQINSGDRIKVGNTTMQFVALCGPDFDW